MKKIALIAALSALIAAPAFATQPSAGGIGGAVISNNIGGTVFTGVNGTASSGAFNNEAAKVTLTQTGVESFQAGGITSNANFAGTTATQSSSGAYNISTGSGSGGAYSTGLAAAGVAGAANVAGVGGGTGVAGAGTQNTITAGTNTAGSIQQSSNSNIQVGVGYIGSNTNIAGGNTQSAQISDSKSGSVNVTSQAQQGYIQNPDGSVVFAGQGLNNAGVAGGGIGGFAATAGASTITSGVTGNGIAVLNQGVTDLSKLNLGL